MAKYRGKHQGKSRGPYARAKLASTHTDPGEWEDTNWHLHRYLSEKGCYLSGAEYDDESAFHDVGAYHLAGATVGKDSMCGKQGYRLDKGNYISLDLASNDNLDDVIEKIQKDFPLFKKLQLDEF